MPKDRGGIGRTGNKHRKRRLFDIHRKLKQPEQPDAQPAVGGGGNRPWLFEEAVARCIWRCKGDWSKALLELQQRGIVNELTDVPELYEIISNMPNGHEILVDLGELEAVMQFGMPVGMNPRAMKPKIVLPPSPKPPRPPRASYVRPRKRGALMRDVEAGIIPLPRPMRPMAR